LPIQIRTFVGLALWGYHWTTDGHLLCGDVFSSFCTVIPSLEYNLSARVLLESNLRIDKNMYEFLVAIDWFHANEDHLFFNHSSLQLRLRFHLRFFILFLHPRSKLTSSNLSVTCPSFRAVLFFRGLQSCCSMLSGSRLEMWQTLCEMMGMRFCERTRMAPFRSQWYLSSHVQNFRFCQISFFAILLTRWEATFTFVYS